MYEFAHIVLAFLYVVSISFAIPAIFIGFKESGYGSMLVFLFAIALLIFHFGLAPKKSFTDLELVQSGVAYFDLDPCCPNNLPWKTAKQFYSLDNGQNGLELPWNGRIWLNPPYSNWVPFIEKLKNHGNGICLIFARTETNGFFNHIWNDADSILFLRKRVKFVKYDLSKAGCSTAPSVLIAYGKNNTESLKNALDNSLLDGKLIELK